MIRVLSTMLLVACAAVPCGAQPVNIDFGAAGSPPSAAYAAAGLAGAWNEIGVLPPGQRAPLVGLDGAPVAAQVYMIGGTALFASDDPATAGDDAALVDDMLIGYNDPVDVCLWVENLTSGTYVVVMYALTPGNAGMTHRVRVDDATPGPTEIGGSWPGGHVEGITFERFTVTITNGRIGLHSGLYGGYFESGINAIQVYPATTGVYPVPGDVGRIRLESVYPNPSRGAQVFVLNVAAGPPAGPLVIMDAAGRVVWRADLAGTAAGRAAVTWDGRDLHGREVPQGVYFARLPGAAGRSDPASVAKFVRIR
jgi:hypothetical protein